MPAAKSHRRQLKLAAYSKPLRTRARSGVASARVAISQDAAAPETEATVKAAVRQLDKAAARGVIHKNNAARRKSRIVQALNKAKAAK